MNGQKYKVINKATYHMYALGEIVERLGYARLLDTYTYVNSRGIIQRLTDDQVEIVLDKEKDEG